MNQTIQHREQEIPRDNGGLTTADLPAEQHFVLSCVSWDGYKTIGDVLLDQPVRITYDRGALEFMTLSPKHEGGKKLLARLVEAMTEELDIDIACFGSMTFQREDLDRGFEPDECYWIEHEPAVRGRTDIDLASDPPPDLALEIEVSRNIINRLGIYAAMRIPEVWRWDGSRLQVLLLGADGAHAESDRSRAFPFLPLAEFARFLVRDTSESVTKHIRSFRAWIRQEAAGWRTTGPA